MFFNFKLKIIEKMNIPEEKKGLAENNMTFLKLLFQDFITADYMQ